MNLRTWKLKSLLLLTLMTLNPLSVQADEAEKWERFVTSTCRRECKAEYADCISDVDENEAEEKKRMDPKLSSVIAFNAREARSTCYEIKKECFRDCRLKKRARPGQVSVGSNIIIHEIVHAAESSPL